MTRAIVLIALAAAISDLAGTSASRGTPVPRAATIQEADEAQRLAARIRGRLAESRALLERFGYFEEDTEIQVDRSGVEEKRETRVYAVTPAPPGGGPDSRLVSVDGRAPTSDEREEDDERRADERDDARRESKDARERRREAIEDLRRGLVVRIDGRAAIDGHQTTIVVFEPRPGARLRSRAGLFIRAMRGRLWATSAGDIVRLEAELVDDVSVGWGLIARIWKGGWLRARQQQQGSAWLPFEMTAEAQGRTLLFRTFRTRYAVRWWGYKLGGSS
ncbi:MAG: hypothetical protein ACRD09_08355 [Vicinamibacterales bacterium]